MAPKSVYRKCASYRTIARCAPRRFSGKKQTSLSTRVGAVIASFIWFPVYQGEREKIYINIQTSIGVRRDAARCGATRRDATRCNDIYRYSINHFGSYLGVLARDKSLNGRIPAKRDGTKRTIRIWNITAPMKISRDKSGRARAFPYDVARRRIRELASQRDDEDHGSINYIVSHFPHSIPVPERSAELWNPEIYTRCQE